MNARSLLVTVPFCLVAVWLVAPANAAAAPPANDNIADAATLDLPRSVGGTVVDATAEDAEPPSCRPTAGSVWYRFRAPAGGRVVALLDTAGELDALVDVVLRSRSEVESVGCEATDRRGQAMLDLEDLEPGASYLIRVAQREGSAADSFRLDVRVPRPPAQPPGRPLPRGGVTAGVSRLVNPSSAWSVRLNEGTTYRINLNPRGTRCVELAIYPPGTHSFETTSPVQNLRCGGYRVLTPRPGRGGKYILVARAARGDRRTQRYHVQVAVAGPDDTAPGLFIGNHARVRGTLEAGAVDVIDLYRFDVVRRSGLFLKLRTPGLLRMVLLDDRGRRIDSDRFLIRRGVPAGRYFVAIRSESDRRRPYRLSRISRTITRSRLTIDGERHATSRPGSAVRIGVSVTPAVAGPVRIDIERFDPLAGWQFLRRVHTEAVGGQASISFVPPAVGRYRARALYLRTRTTTASATNVASLLVASPLRE